VVIVFKVIAFISYIIENFVGKHLKKRDVKMKSFIFWDITLYSLLKINQCFGGFCHLHLQGQRMSLKMGAMCFSETSVDFQQTTGHYVPKDRILFNHCCENLKS
jgi:hypothetical protein